MIPNRGGTPKMGTMSGVVQHLKKELGRAQKEVQSAHATGATMLSVQSSHV